jgi:hypothetical protein
MAEPRGPGQIIERFRAGNVPLQARLAAARGALPVSREELVEILFLLRKDPDVSVRKALKGSLSNLDARVLVEPLQQAPLHPAILDFFARACFHREEILEAILQNPKTHDKTVEFLAERVDTSLQEIILLNQVRLARYPALLDAIVRNPKLLTTTRRRVEELKHILATAPATPEPEPATPPAPATPETEPAPPPTAAPPTAAAPEAPAAEVLEEEVVEPEAVAAEPEPADAEELEALQDELLADGAEEAVEDALADSLSQETQDLKIRISQMSVPEKIELALKGDRPSRNILIRDANKLIAESVLKSPKITDAELEFWAQNRSLDEDILRTIGTHRKWARKKTVVKLLVYNPKVPVGVSVPLIKQLTVRELKDLAACKNIPGVLRSHAKKLYTERTTRKDPFTKKH